MFPLAPLLAALCALPASTLDEPPAVAARVLAAWVDVDGDGRPDRLERCEGEGALCIRHNASGATPAELAWRTGSAALPLAADARLRGAAWADFDGDARPDLFLVGEADQRDRLLRQLPSGGFLDASLEFGLDRPPTGLPRSASWADFDGDGRLDLLLLRVGAPDLLFLREPAATFKLVEHALSPALGERATLIEDLDGDGDLDVLVLLADPALGNLAYFNRGDASFIERSARTGLDLAGTSRGAALGDLDGDGRPELVVAREEGDRVLALEDGRWIDVTEASGLDPRAPGHAHVRLVDVDLDASLDLLLAGGSEPLVRIHKSQARGGLAPGEELAKFPAGSALSLADVDGDGVCELAIITPAGVSELHELVPDGRAGLRIVPRGLMGNTDGLGAEVRTLLADGSALYRRIWSAQGDEAAACFGLGGHWRAREVRVLWGDGGVTRMQGVPAAPIVPMVRTPGSRLVASHPAALLDGPAAFDLDAALARAAAALDDKLPSADATISTRRADELLAFALARDLAQAPGPGTLAERLQAAGGGSRGARLGYLGALAYDVDALAAAARAAGLESRPEVASALQRIEDEVRLDTAVRVLVMHERPTGEEIEARIKERAAEWAGLGRVWGARISFATRDQAQAARTRIAAGESLGELVTELDLIDRASRQAWARDAHVMPFECDAPGWSRLAPTSSFEELVALGPDEPSPVFDSPGGAFFLLVRGVAGGEALSASAARRRAESELTRERAERRVDALLGFE